MLWVRGTRKVFPCLDAGGGGSLVLLTTSLLEKKIIEQIMTHAMTITYFFYFNFGDILIPVLPVAVGVQLVAGSGHVIDRLRC